MESFYRVSILIGPAISLRLIDGINELEHLTGLGKNAGVILFAMAATVFWLWVLDRYLARERRAWIKALDPVRHRNVAINDTEGCDVVFFGMDARSRQAAEAFRKGAAEN